MQDIKFRTLRADEIECRPAAIKDGKVTILLYIDSRAVVRLLNETLGPTNWCMEFEEVKGQLVGKLGIWDEDKGVFVYKSDTGSESNIEATKGLFSDCYKRCLSRWGVDELYTAPRIVIADDGYNCSGYKVSKIAYNDNREIVELHIVNRFGKPVFDWGGEKVSAPAPKESGNKVEELRAFCTMKKQEGVNRNELKRFFEWYVGKAEKWNGPFNVQSLWDKWVEKAAA